jgi:hypothetical protein
MNRASQVRELVAPAVIVAVLPDKLHFAEIAAAGGVEEWSIAAKQRYAVKAEPRVKVHVVPEDIEQLPAKLLAAVCCTVPAIATGIYMLGLTPAILPGPRQFSGTLHVPGTKDDDDWVEKST